MCLCVRRKSCTGYHLNCRNQIKGLLKFTFAVTYAKQMLISRNCTKWRQLLQTTNIKSYMLCRLAPLLMTFSNL